MRLIALRGFKNNAKELIANIVDRSGKPIADMHPDAVPAGARFTIGGDVHVDDDGMPQKHRLLIRDFAARKCIGDAADIKLCSKVDAEVAQAAKQVAEQKKMQAAGSTGHIVAIVMAVLQQAGVIPNPEAAATATGRTGGGKAALATP